MAMEGEELISDQEKVTFCPQLLCVGTLWSVMSDETPEDVNQTIKFLVRSVLHSLSLETVVSTVNDLCALITIHSMMQVPGYKLGKK